MTAALIRKDSTMRSKLLLIALGSALAGCNVPPMADQGLASVNVPVVTSADYVFDAAAPGGALAPGESDRLNGWLAGLGLGIGLVVQMPSGVPQAVILIAHGLGDHSGRADLQTLSREGRRKSRVAGESGRRYRRSLENPAPR